MHDPEQAADMHQGLGDKRRFGFYFCAAVCGHPSRNIAVCRTELGRIHRNPFGFSSGPTALYQYRHPRILGRQYQRVSGLTGRQHREVLGIARLI